MVIQLSWNALIRFLKQLAVLPAHKKYSFFLQTNYVNGFNTKTNNLRHNFSKTHMDTLCNADALKKWYDCRKTRRTIKQNI